MEDKRKEGPLERGGKGQEKNFSTLLDHMFGVLLQRPSARKGDREGGWVGKGERHFLHERSVWVQGPSFKP